MSNRRSNGVSVISANTTPGLLQEVGRLSSDARALLEGGRPVTASILRALEKSGGEVMTPLNPHDKRAAVILLGEALVRRAIAGDGRAAEMIAERTEGRVGLRTPEVESDDSERRARVQAAIAEIITGWTEDKRRGGEDNMRLSNHRTRDSADSAAST